ncbi:MAG TPA: SAM-dependent methyltransferase [Candidatus Acidoferrum sp.]|nr:SAM-dependent methyltransferase [Candidatus Acidoferrum sp.]
MTENESLIRNISDTALFAAIYRARETERRDALFRDLFARRLAGERGDRIAKSIPFSERATWAWITRTYLFDEFIKQQVEQGTDTVIDLAAGLDTRPYRMALPSALKWIEVDLPDVLAYKEQILRGEKSACELERIGLDLSNVAIRWELFARIGSTSRRALVITEGFLIYLSDDEVASLARDLATIHSFQCWLLDIASPGLLKMLKQRMGPQIERGGGELRFGPEEGPDSFTSQGWRVDSVRSMLKTAAKLKRLSPWMSLISLMPESKGKQGSRPWSGVCLLRHQSAHS